jgi:hypothetical protein
MKTLESRRPRRGRVREEQRAKRCWIAARETLLALWLQHIRSEGWRMLTPKEIRRFRRRAGALLNRIERDPINFCYRILEFDDFESFFLRYLHLAWLWELEDRALKEVEEFVREFERERATLAWRDAYDAA